MDKKHFFVSYTQADRGWAEWIAWELEKAGYSVVIQAWDFRPADNFVVRMQEASTVAEKTIAVLSPDYLASRFTQPEWSAAFHQDPTGTKGLLLPIRVRICDLPGLLPQIIYIDLVDLSEEDARTRLLAGVSRARAKPGVAPAFPNRLDTSAVAAPKTVTTAPATDVAYQTEQRPVKSSVTGQWKTRFSYADGQWYDERIQAIETNDGQFIAHIVPSLDNHQSTASVDHLRPERASGSVSGSRFITGVWRHPVRSDQEGAFQLRISSEDDKIIGGWLKFSDSRNDVVSGSWEWARATPRSEAVIGVYGVTGAGKTSLCQELILRAPDCRFFTESDILTDFMRRTDHSDFRAFREKTESERMRIREAAFTLHAERVQNSDGLLFGDAHFSFPRIRLGAIEQEHPDAEDGIQPVMPSAAWKLYTVIVYLDPSPAVVQERLPAIAAVDSRNAWAASLTVLEIQRWIEYEKRKLKHECVRRGVPFIAVAGEASPEELSSEVMQRIRALTLMHY